MQDTILEFVICLTKGWKSVDTIKKITLTEDFEMSLLNMQFFLFTYFKSHNVKYLK